jgi:hypothetical protein
MKVIKLTTTNGEYKLFQNYHQFCGYINDIEKEKWKASKSGERNWMFIRRPHQTLAALYHRSPSLRDSFTHKEKEAIEKELVLIEILKGDRENFIQILCTPYLDTEPLKRNWCQEYCVRHGMEIFEFVKQ